MPVWKVLVVALFGVVCLGLALATIVVPMSKTGGEWWAWMGGLIAGTLLSSCLFALFLRHAGSRMQ